MTLGNQEVSSMWGHNYALIRARAGNCGAENYIVTKCERAALFSIESDVLCAPGHFLEIRSMAEEGWDWTQ